MNAVDRLLTRLAAELDLLGDRVPPGFELNFVLVHETDPSATISIGKSDPQAVVDALTFAIANPGRVGIANAQGVAVDI